jgi:hypothetical protein
MGGRRRMIAGIMAPVIKVAGVAIATLVVEKVMEKTGHEDKIVFVSIISWVTCAYIALDFWWDGVKYVMQTFGVG